MLGLYKQSYQRQEKEAEKEGEIKIINFNINIMEDIEFSRKERK